jgi:hypothetical protein
MIKIQIDDTGANGQGPHIHREFVVSNHLMNHFFDEVDYVLDSVDEAMQYLEDLQTTVEGIQKEELKDHAREPNYPIFEDESYDLLSMAQRH